MIEVMIRYSALIEWVRVNLSMFNMIVCSVGCDMTVMNYDTYAQQGYDVE